MRRKFQLKVMLYAMLTLLLAAGFESRAQECGDVTLADALELYNIGNFEKALERLEPCMADGFNTQQLAGALALQAKTYLAIDSLQRAYSAAEKLLRIRPNFEPDLFDPYRFISIVNQLKAAGKSVTVTSVSKKAENILQAPATVVVLQQEELLKRGYQDLEQMLHDLPGFDMAKGSGPGYSTFYQRGYRSISTDRTLLLVDGVEENDLVSSAAIVSRQYPLSSIKRVEIVYGPASTMYGANAFLGVINIITHENSELLADEREYDFNALAGYGTFNTRYVDFTATGKHSDVSLSLSARLFESDEMDLSGYDDWDYAIHGRNYYDGVMNISGTTSDGGYAAQQYLDASGLLNEPGAGSDYYDITYDANNTAVAVNLTEAGYQRAAEFDRQMFNSNPLGNPIEFNNRSMNWLVKAKLQTGKFTFGLQSWKTSEGSLPWYTDDYYISSEDYTRWAYFNSFLYMHYENRLSDQLLLTSLSSYRYHIIDGETNFTVLDGYYSGDLGFLELVRGTSPSISSTYYYRSSTQLRSELRLLYDPFTDLNVLAGVEYRNSMIQGDYITSSEPNPEETGTPRDQGFLGAPHFRGIDVGLFAQASWYADPELILTFGARYDYNQIRQTGGYGSVFNPRVAVVYSPGDFVLKAIYAEAFKDASNLQKYGTIEGREMPNPNLEPERVKNFELGASWQPFDDLLLDAVWYQSYYSQVIGTATVTLPDDRTTGQFQALGEQEIMGLQAQARYTMDNYKFWLNYTTTYPHDTQADQRISDIANHIVNAGASASYGERLHVHLRANFVGERETGPGTSGSSSPFNAIDPYLVFHAAVSYDDILPGVGAQLILNNIFDTEYFHPGIRAATGRYASRYPQNSRSLQFRLTYGL